MSRKMALFGTVVLGFSLAVPGHAVDKPKPRSDGLICRTIDVTGSRLGSQRVCMSREQWEVNRKDAQSAVAENQRRMNAACPAKTTC